MLSDLNYIVFWWLTILVLSLLSLPWVFILFKKFWDKGYIFAKIISLVSLTYLIFVLGVFHFLPFTGPAIFALVVFIAVLNFYFLSQKNRFSRFKKIISQNYKSFIFQEVLFLAILTIWSFVRGFAPHIEGLEKFMDWGFVNSALRTQFMPPQDMWYAGQPINYYYFGHLIFALVTKVSGINSAITYNLSIATVCALTFGSVFSLASNLANQLKSVSLKKIILVGLVSALLATFGGNLHTAYKIGKLSRQNQQSLAEAARSYWYPDATRFIGFDPDTDDKTIHEFPVYSFVVADLHGHMNGLPIVIFFTAFLFSRFLVRQKFLNWPLILISALTLSAAFMTNAWDFAVYGLLLAVFSLFYNLSRLPPVSALTRTLANGLLIIAFWYLFSLPFNLNFAPMTQGIKISDAHSPFYQLFILYGGFWLINLPVLFAFIPKMLGFSHHKFTPAQLFLLSLIITATILVIIPELIYVKDIYIFEHRRANTMFKLVYQAFLLYSIAAGASLLWFSHSRLYKTVFIFVFVIHLVYPYFAIKSYYGLRQYQGLWGLNFLKQSYPENLEAVEWINNNIDGQPVMLEAVGDSYTTYNQISMATGLPTVQGWIVHEWLWRNGYDQPAARQQDVANIYQGQDLSQVRSLLQKYSVDYIFIGAKEREKYPDLNTDNFEKLNYPITAQFGDTLIYQVK